MVCKPCQDDEHEKCPGGTWCDCGHRPRKELWLYDDIDPKVADLVNRFGGYAPEDPAIVIVGPASPETGNVPVIIRAEPTNREGSA